MPSHYIFDSKKSKYMDENDNFRQSNRELGIRRLMAINLLKRLESSVNSFSLTLQRIYSMISSTITTINEYEKKHGVSELDVYDITDDDFDMDDSNADFTVGKKVRIDLADIDYRTWRADLQKDKDSLELLISMIGDITPEHDTKLQTLFKLISQKQNSPINAGNKKMIIFTAFSDTAEYLYDNVSTYVKKKFGLDTAVVTGSVDGKTTIKLKKTNLNNVLTLFSPVSKGRDVLMPGSTQEIDILIATDGLI